MSGFETSLSSIYPVADFSNLALFKCFASVKKKKKEVLHLQASKSRKQTR